MQSLGVSHEPSELQPRNIQSPGRKQTRVLQLYAWFFALSWLTATSPQRGSKQKQAHAPHASNVLVQDLHPFSPEAFAFSCRELSCRTLECHLSEAAAGALHCRARQILRAA